MKIKALRYKDTKEFVHIEQFDDEPQICTSELPKVQPESATLELMKKIFNEEDFYEGFELDWERMELVEFDLIEAGVVGADIRNELTPLENLLALLKLLKKEQDSEKKKILEKFINKEIDKCEISIKYIANLL